MPWIFGVATGVVLLIGNADRPVPVVFRVTYSPASKFAWSVEQV